MLPWQQVLRYIVQYEKSTILQIGLLKFKPYFSEIPNCTIDGCNTYVFMLYIHSTCIALFASFQGNLLDANHTEVRIDSCTGDDEDEVEITVLWEEGEPNNNSGETGKYVSKFYCSNVISIISALRIFFS